MQQSLCCSYHYPLTPSTPDISGVDGFDKLTATQQAQVIANVSTMATNTSGVIPTVEKMDQYVDLGEHIGKMLGGAAKEIGVAVTTFVQTPVGKVTTYIIVWKLLGHDLVHIAGGLLILLVGFPFIWYLIQRSRDITIEYDKSTKNMFGDHPVTSVVKSQLTSDMIVGSSIMGAIVIGAAMLTIFTM